MADFYGASRCVLPDHPVYCPAKIIVLFADPASFVVGCPRHSVWKLMNLDSTSHNIVLAIILFPFLELVLTHSGAPPFILGQLVFKIVDGHMDLSPNPL